MSNYRESNFSTNESYNNGQRVSYEVSASSAESSAVFGGRSVSSLSGTTQSSVSQIASDLLQFSRTGAASSLSSGFSSTSTVINAAVTSQYSSEIETAILRSTTPIRITESEEINVLGNKGIWANRAEVMNWKGILPINQYSVNEDSNPLVISKKIRQQLEYLQELAIRYLRPPSPPAPGEIVIQQEANVLSPPAPPLIIRQQPPRPPTPEPLVLREAPPQPPASIGRKLITIGGKRLPPPPRKVVIERLAQLPSKPQSVIIERWLPYIQGKRRVIFQKSKIPDPIVVKPRNVIIQWEAPQVVIKQEVKYLGVVQANPVDYVSRYGSSLKLSKDLPQFVLDIKTPDGLKLAADYKYSSVYELEGDVSAMKMIDLERVGLGEYRSYLERIGISSTITESYSSISASGSFMATIEEIFASVDADMSGKIGVGEAERILLRLNSRLGRNYGEDEVRNFFRVLDTNGDGSIDLIEFKQAFININF